MNDVVSLGNQVTVGVRPEYRRLTFTLAAFVAAPTKPIAQIFLISNFNHLDGRVEPTPADKLWVEWTRCRRPMVIVTGATDAVSWQDRRLLGAALRAKTEDRAMRKMIAAVNNRSARGDRQNRVTQAGWISSLLYPDGTGGGGGAVHGAPWAPMHFVIMHGESVRDSVRKAWPEMMAAQKAAQSG